ncbi:MAG: ABC transporter ATP-binding protein [Eggerthellaceae bacterium]|jgi:energy-coupling factor transporter ATP-binding protein EcfA2
MAHFAIKNLTFTYPGAQAPALDNVSLDIQEGSYVVLCGKSGCGKTTLLRHLKPPLAPHGTRSGTVLFRGVPIDDVDPREQAAGIGFVMQDPDAQVVTDKVWHELAFGLESLGCDARTMRLRVAEMASYFGIQNWFHRDVRDLSGGQKQLLNLASVMAMQPSALMLDEPTSQLDPIAAGNFLNTVRKINRELGTTVILSEHRLEEVFPAADRVLVMDRGRIAADGTPREVGAALYEHGSDMMQAVPAPLRIYYGVRGTGAAGTGGSGAPAASERAREGASEAPESPLTVREGRTWLSAAYGERAGAAPALPSEPPLPDDFTAAVEMKGVWMRYEREAPDVLRGVDLRVPEGTLTAIVGGNGTGKSTLLKALCGVVRPYRGTVRIQGRKLKEYRRGELFRHRVAMLPQDPRNLFVHKTVREDLAEMLDESGLSEPERRQRVEQEAELVGIEGLLDRHPYDLSGGEQQRAGLAKVLLAQPQILLLDEPTKGIDDCFKGRLAQLFADLRSGGATIIMASHDIEFCARYADLVAMFFDGAVVTANTPRRFFSQNSFYTTAANRMARRLFPDAVTDQEVISLCRSL